MIGFLLRAGALYAVYKIASELMAGPGASGSDRLLAHEPSEDELGAVDDMYKEAAITLDEEGAAEGSESPRP